MKFRMEYVPLFLAAALLLLGANELATAANVGGQCKVKATFTSYAVEPATTPPSYEWRLTAVDCVGDCPPPAEGTVICHEYLVQLDPRHPTYSCACKYTNGEVVEWDYSAQVCDGYYTRNTRQSGALDPKSHFCAGPCGPGKACMTGSDEPPTIPETTKDENCDCR